MAKKYFKDNYGIAYDTDTLSVVGFDGNKNISTLRIKDGTISIADRAFAYRGSIKEVYLPESLRQIGKHAFSKCRNLEKIHFNDGLEMINAFAFLACESIKEIKLPACISVIGLGAFCDCENLNKVIINSENRNFAADEHFVYTKNKRGIVYVIPKLLPEQIVIPNGVEEIKAGAFWGVKIKRVVLPETIRAIRKFAFHECNNLEQVNLPEGLKIIEDASFGYTRLKQITLPSSIRDIGKEVFASCQQLTSIQAHKNSKYMTIDGVLFSVADGVLLSYPIASHRKKYLIPDFVKSIANEAFGYAHNLQYVICNRKLVEIEDRAFIGCSALKEVELSNEIRRIGQAAFMDCKNLISIDLPRNLSSLGAWAFHSCEKLRKIHFSANLMFLHEEAFAACNVEYTVSPENKRFIVCNGILYEKKLYNSEQINSETPF